MIYEITLKNNETIRGMIIAKDDIKAYHISQLPEKGSLELNSRGCYIYEPYHAVYGIDLFKIELEYDNGEVQTIIVQLTLMENQKESELVRIYLENILKMDDKYYEDHDIKDIVIEVDQIILNDQKDMSDVIIEGIIEYVFENQFLGSSDNLKKEFVTSFRVATEKIIDKNLDIVVDKNRLMINKLDYNRYYTKIPLVIKSVLGK